LIIKSRLKIEFQREKLQFIADPRKKNYFFKHSTA